MKALLIYPSPIAEIPHSLALIAAIFKEQGWEVKGVINTFKKPLSNDDFVRVAQEYAPDVIGVNIQSIFVLNTYALIKRLKPYCKWIIAGGAHVTDCPEEVVEYGVDIAVRNEGEGAVRDFCKILAGEVPSDQTGMGITYRNCGKIISAPLRPRAKSLEDFPPPDFTPFDIELFRIDDGLIKGINRVYSSRGCPGKCTYCDWQVFGQKVVFSPVLAVIEEIRKRNEQYGITNFMIADDCFTASKKHVADFCREIVKIHGIKWQTSARADQVTPELMQMMADAGCYMVSIGVESGSPDTLKRINKRCTVEQNIDAVQTAAAYGMQVVTNLMFGFPWETVDHLNETLDMIYKIWDATYMFQVSGAVVPFPGSQIYKDYHQEYGFTKYWLKPEYQGYSVQIYQNALNPYAVSTYFQRNLYDTTYIDRDVFFKYTPEYKKRLWEVISETGRHNIEKFYPEKWKQKAIYNLARLSRKVYEINPDIEKAVGGKLYEWFGRARPKAEDYRNQKKGIVKD